MTETPMLFGPDTALVGVLTQPAPGGSADLAFLMFNAGVISRKGPHRINVKLARALAQSGHTSFRFDLSGHGDSRNVDSEGDLQALAVRDLHSAMDHLAQNLGICRFALIGICSGAAYAFAAARVDSRVTGILMFDGHWYRTRWTLPVRNWKRFRAVSWAGAAAAVGRRIGGLFPTRSGPSMPTPLKPKTTLGNPPRREFVTSMQALADRGVAIFVVYSGSVVDYYSYAGQFRDAFAGEPFVSKVRCDFRPDFDHTLIALDVQRDLIALVCDWGAQLQRASTPTR
jgi:pimeloyl-ACP methyl ester carboxylesterase